MDSESESDDFDAQEFAIVQELQAKAAKENQEKQAELRFNAEGIEACLSELKLPEHFHWVESLSITTPEPYVLENLNDDLTRESQFYAATLEGVKQAITRLEADQIPYERPPDFYAEMVKPDSQMARIKDSLIREKKKMAFVQQRREARQASKMAKEVSIQKRLEKGAGKREAKATLAAIKAKKGKNKTDLRVPRTHLTDSIKEAASNSEHKPNRKRAAANKKYGHGGKKKRLKSNNSESLHDTAFPFKRNKAQGPNRTRIKASSKGQKRPGKNARAKARR